MKYTLADAFMMFVGLLNFIVSIGCFIHGDLTHGLLFLILGWCIGIFVKHG